MWVDFENYCQLIHNADDKITVYDMLPRTGAFEVSTVLGGNQDILFYSKMMSKTWPNPSGLAEKVANCLKQSEKETANLKQEFQTTGVVAKVPRNSRANKSGSLKQQQSQVSIHAKSQAKI